ncbi:MAG: AsmA family protein [Alphaproteobacteria bacterium]|nr:AsmA family protein [Alphaproteobacteria bacterium]
MRRILPIAGIVLGALILLVLALPFLVPMDAYKGRIEDAAFDQTGRRLSIGGSLRLSFYPVLGLKAHDVALANVPGGKADALAKIDALSVGVRVWPLLSGKVEVSRLVLEKPQIHLEVDRNGGTNWTFKSAKEKKDAEEKKASLKADAQFGGISISDGEISYFNARTGKTRAISDIDATIDVMDLTSPVTLHAEFTLNKERLTLDGTVQSPDALREETGTRAKLALDGDALNATFDGVLTSKGDADGTLVLKTQSLKRLIALTGSKSSAGGFGAMSLSATLKARESFVGLNGLKVSLDGTGASGNLAINTARTIPAVKGALTIGDLNLNRFTDASAKSDSANPDVAPKEAGWSTKPIDLSALELINADLTLDVGRLEVQSLKVGKSRIHATINNGVLVANLDPITLYGGSGKARLSASAGGNFANNLSFNNLQVKPFLTDALGVSRIEGLGTVTLDITAAGKSPQAIMRALGGKGAITFRNGRIRGVDLGGVAKSIRTVLNPSTTSDDATTDFTEMGGTFTIANGVLTNKDFHLASPFLRLTGAGTIDIGQRTINYVVSPKAVASATGQGASDDARGLGIPFHITGSWDKLHYSPDLAGFASGLLQGITSDKGISTKRLLNGLFGGSDKEAAPADSTANKEKNKKKESPVDALKGLFGGN